MKSFEDALILLCICLSRQVRLFTYGFLQEVSGVGPRASPNKLTSDGDAETGSVILGNLDRLVSAMVQPGLNQGKKTVRNPTVGKIGSS